MFRPHTSLQYWNHLRRLPVTFKEDRMRYLLLATHLFACVYSFRFPSSRYTHSWRPAAVDLPPDTSTTTSASSGTPDLVVTDDGNKKRLDAYLTTQFEDYSRSYFEDLCTKGFVAVNGSVRKKNFKVSTGDTITLEMAPKVSEDFNVVAEDIPLDIVYEDEQMIAINKPKGMVVHPAPGSPNGTFVNALLHHLGENATNLIPATEDELDILSSEYLDGDSDDQYLIDNSDTMGDNSNAMKDLPETPEAAKASPVQLRPGVVHRLDKGTTGILLAGKNPFAVGKLSSLFEKRLVEKTYLAICVGHPGTTTIVESIGRSDKNRQTMTVYDDGRGKLAISHVRTIAFDGKLSACLVRIETGRTHQIRVHLQHRRTPVLGDETYGKADWNKKYHRGDKIDRPLLHAYETKFVNPFTKEELSLRAPLPEDMRNLLKKVSFNLKDQVLDMDSGMLTCDTFVEGDDYVGEREKKGYVPMDRLQMEEDHWTSYDLPETLEELEE